MMTSIKSAYVKLNTFSCISVHTLLFLEVFSGGALYPAAGRLLVLLEKKTLCKRFTNGSSDWCIILVSPLPNRCGVSSHPVTASILPGASQNLYAWASCVIDGRVFLTQENKRDTRTSKNIYLSFKYKPTRLAFCHKCCDATHVLL